VLPWVAAAGARWHRDVAASTILLCWFDCVFCSCLLCSGCMQDAALTALESSRPRSGATAVQISSARHDIQCNTVVGHLSTTLSLRQNVVAAHLKGKSCVSYFCVTAEQKSKALPRNNAESASSRTWLQRQGLPADSCTHSSSDTHWSFLSFRRYTSQYTEAVTQNTVPRRPAGPGRLRSTPLRCSFLAGPAQGSGSCLLCPASGQPAGRRAVQCTPMKSGESRPQAEQTWYCWYDCRSTTVC